MEVMLPSSSRRVCRDVSRIAAPELHVTFWCSEVFEPLLTCQRLSPSGSGTRGGQHGSQPPWVVGHLSRRDFSGSPAAGDQFAMPTQQSRRRDDP